MRTLVFPQPLHSGAALLCLALRVHTLVFLFGFASSAHTRFLSYWRARPAMRVFFVCGRTRPAMHSPVSHLIGAYTPCYARALTRSLSYWRTRRSLRVHSISFCVAHSLFCASALTRLLYTVALKWSRTAPSSEALSSSCLTGLS